MSKRVAFLLEPEMEGKRLAACLRQALLNPTLAQGQRF